MTVRALAARSWTVCGRTAAEGLGKLRERRVGVGRVCAHGQGKGGDSDEREATK
jgi:hypothetical protein